MITDEERAAIRAEVAEWAPLCDAERDLVSRALAPLPRAAESPAGKSINIESAA